MKLNQEQCLQLVILGYELAKQARASGWMIYDRANDMECITLEDLQAYEERGKLKESEPTTPRAYLKSELSDLLASERPKKDELAAETRCALYGWSALANHEDDDEEAVRSALREYANAAYAEEWGNEEEDDGDDGEDGDGDGGDDADEDGDGDGDDDDADEDGEDEDGDGNNDDDNNE